MSVWTLDRVARLKTLWPLGWSARQIADVLGDDITRSAVLGKVYRMKLSETRPSRPYVDRGAAIPALPLRSPKPAPKRSAPRAAMRIASRTESETSAPAHGTATILSVRRCDCRFPYGDPGTPAFRLCGRPVARGAFCAAHAGIAYRPTPQSAEALMQLAGWV